MAEYSGNFLTPKGRFALIAARFNALIVDRLVEGARGTLIAHGVDEADIDIVRVPGALEIPLAAHWLAGSGKHAAIICLGAVIQGDTDHYDVVVHQSARGIADAAIAHKVPVLNAVLTTHTLEQAMDRAGGKAGNKGADAAVAAIEMVNLQRSFRGGSP